MTCQLCGANAGLHRCVSPKIHDEGLRLAMEEVQRREAVEAQLASNPLLSLERQLRAQAKAKKSTMEALIVAADHALSAGL